MQKRIHGVTGGNADIPDGTDLQELDLEYLGMIIGRTMVGVLTAAFAVGVLLGVALTVGIFLAYWLLA